MVEVVSAFTGETVFKDLIVPVAVIKTEKKQDTFRGQGHLGIKHEKAGDAAKETEKESMVKLLNRCNHKKGIKWDTAGKASLKASSGKTLPKGVFLNDLDEQNLQRHADEMVAEEDAGPSKGTSIFVKKRWTFHIKSQEMKAQWGVSLVDFSRMEKERTNSDQSKKIKQAAKLRRKPKARGDCHGTYKNIALDLDIVLPLTVEVRSTLHQQEAFTFKYDRVCGLGKGIDADDDMTVGDLKEVDHEHWPDVPPEHQVLDFGPKVDASTSSKDTGVSGTLLGIAISKAPEAATTKAPMCPEEAAPGFREDENTLTEAGIVKGCCHIVLHPHKEHHESHTETMHKIPTWKWNGVLVVGETFDRHNQIHDFVNGIEAGPGTDTTNHRECVDAHFFRIPVRHTLWGEVNPSPLAPAALVLWLTLHPSLRPGRLTRCVSWRTWPSFRLSCSDLMTVRQEAVHGHEREHDSRPQETDGEVLVQLQRRSKRERQGPTHQRGRCRPRDRRHGPARDPWR